MWEEAVRTDPTEVDPTLLRHQFRAQLQRIPKAEALSRTASSVALAASQLGLLAGAAETALGLVAATPWPSQALVTPIQEAYFEGIDSSKQEQLFELGYRHGRALIGPS